MTRRTLTDEERIASIREVIEAARGDWHEATALRSIGADLNWLFERAVAREDAPEPPGTSRTLAILRAELASFAEPYDKPDDPYQRGKQYGLALAIGAIDSIVVREDAPSREGLDRLRKEIHPFADDRTVQYRSGWNDALAAAALAATPPGDREAKHEHTPDCSSRFARDGVTGEAICDCGIEEAAVATAEAAAGEEGS